MRTNRVLVIGGGIVGLATAYKLQLSRPGTEVTVLEKEDAVGRHQSGHNSGVLHAGLYYRPGSFKARLAVAGIREMTSFCVAHGIPHEICGKLVVAADEAEVARLRTLHERGQENGLRDLRWLGPEEMREVEPNVGGVAALAVPEEGIVDYRRVCEVLVELLESAGGRVMTRARVTRLRRIRNGWIAETTRGEYEAGFVVSCAGLHADRIARSTGHRTDVRIVPFRGEYYLLRPERRHLVRNLIYPVPDPAFPFLGVHFTRMIQGGVEAGPNAVLALAREGYTGWSVSPRDAAETLTFPGLWRFLRRYAGASWMELARSLSKRRFVASLQRLVPEVQPEDLVRGGAGVRAQAMRGDGSLVEDFEFAEGPAILYVLNAPSPAATASLAIGAEIVSRIDRSLAA